MKSIMESILKSSPGGTSCSAPDGITDRAFISAGHAGHPTLQRRLRKALALTCAGVLAAAVTACSSSSSSFSMVSLNGNIEIKAENCDTDTDSSTGITVDDGDVLVVESALTAGSLNIRVLADGKAEGDAADAEQSFAGSDTGELTLPGAGDYTVYCSALENGTSGTMKIYITDGGADGADADDADAPDKAAGADEADAENAAAAAGGAGAAGEAADIDGDVEMPEDEGMPALEQAALEIDDYLDEEWGDLRKVTYTLEEDTVYTILWADGINSGTIDDVTDWDEVRSFFDGLAEDCTEIMKNNGLENGHVYLQLVSDVEDDTYLIYVDRDVTWDYFGDADQQDNADGQAQAGASGGYLIMSEEEQKAVIADWVGCAPENLFYVGDGTYDNSESVSVYGYVDNGGGEADIRLLLFDDGEVYGFTPDRELINVEDYFAN